MPWMVTIWRHDRLHRWAKYSDSEGEKKLHYFTSSYPHHDIYTFCYWQNFLHSIWHISWHFIWHIFWQSMRHIFWYSTWHIFWHMFWLMFWHIFWHIFWHSMWHSMWQIFWRSIGPLRSSGAHWARKVPGWGPAVRTALGRSQVEVLMSWEIGDELGAELARRTWRWKLMQTWSRRN